MAPLNFSDDEFTYVLRQARALYRGLDQIKCPYFQANVKFTAQGLEHLRRKSWNRGRERRDQFMRLKYLVHAPQILQLSRTVQGIQETNDWERQRKHGRWEQRLVPVTYYEFVAVLSEVGLKSPEVATELVLLDKAAGKKSGRKSTLKKRPSG